MEDLDETLSDISKNRLHVPTDHPPKKQPVSKSQALRFTLHRRWQNEAAAAMPFEAFYEREMDKIIEEQNNKSVHF